MADRFGLPDELYQKGVRRYGFHGLSYEYIARRLKEVAPEIAEGRVVVAHLGSGASLCAIKNGKSIDTTMGFSALDGLPMGTRCGRLDPGVLLYLMREKRMDLDAIENLLYKESGLLGISGISNDLRDLLAEPGTRAPSKPSITSSTGSGRNSAPWPRPSVDWTHWSSPQGSVRTAPEIRRRVCLDAAWLGIELDEEANRKGRQRISRAGSAPRPGSYRRMRSA